jgi:hypothetical protein
MKTPEKSITTTRRALLGAAVAASSAAALPVMASAVNVAVRPVFDDPVACPAVQAHRDLKRLQTALNALPGDIEEDHPLCEEESAAGYKFAMLPATSLLGVALKLKELWGFSFTRDGRFIPSGFPLDDRLKYGALRDLYRMAGLEPPKLAKPRPWRRKEMERLVETSG